MLIVSASSTSGYVNIYGAGEALGTGADKPKPLKTLGNLNTAISTLTFNHDSQLLAMASNDRKDQLRLVRRRELHLPRFALVVLNSANFIDPLAVAYCFLKLADLWDAAWASAER